MSTTKKLGSKEVARSVINGTTRVFRISETFLLGQFLADKGETGVESGYKFVAKKTTVGIAAATTVATTASLLANKAAQEAYSLRADLFRGELMSGMTNTITRASASTPVKMKQSEADIQKLSDAMKILRTRTTGASKVSKHGATAKIYKAFNGVDWANATSIKKKYKHIADISSDIIFDAVEKKESRNILSGEWKTDAKRVYSNLSADSVISGTAAKRYEIKNINSRLSGRSFDIRVINSSLGNVCCPGGIAPFLTTDPGSVSKVAAEIERQMKTHTSLLSGVKGRLTSKKITALLSNGRLNAKEKAALQVLRNILLQKEDLILKGKISGLRIYNTKDLTDKIVAIGGVCESYKIMNSASIQDVTQMLNNYANALDSHVPSGIKKRSGRTKKWNELTDKEIQLFKTTVADSKIVDAIDTFVDLRDQQKTLNSINEQVSHLKEEIAFSIEGFKAENVIDSADRLAAFAVLHSEKDFTRFTKETKSIINKEILKGGGDASKAGKYILGDIARGKINVEAVIASGTFCGAEITADLAASLRALEVLAFPDATIVSDIDDHIKAVGAKVGKNTPNMARMDDVKRKLFEVNNALNKSGYIPKGFKDWKNLTDKDIKKLLKKNVYSSRPEVVNLMQDRLKLTAHIKRLRDVSLGAKIRNAFRGSLMLASTALGESDIGAGASVVMRSMPIAKLSAKASIKLAAISAKLARFSLVKTVKTLAFIGKHTVYISSYLLCHSTAPGKKAMTDASRAINAALTKMRGTFTKYAKAARSAADALGRTLKKKANYFVGHTPAGKVKAKVNAIANKKAAKKAEKLAKKAAAQKAKKHVLKNAFNKFRALFLKFELIAFVVILCIIVFQYIAMLLLSFSQATATAATTLSDTLFGWVENVDWPWNRFVGEEDKQNVFYATLCDLQQIETLSEDPEHLISEETDDGRKQYRGFGDPMNRYIDVTFETEVKKGVNSLFYYYTKSDGDALYGFPKTPYSLTKLAMSMAHVATCPIEKEADLVDYMIYAKGTYEYLRKTTPVAVITLTNVKALTFRCNCMKDDIGFDTTMIRYIIVQDRVIPFNDYGTIDVYLVKQNDIVRVDPYTGAPTEADEHDMSLAIVVDDNFDLDSITNPEDIYEVLPRETSSYADSGNAIGCRQIYYDVRNNTSATYDNDGNLLETTPVVTYHLRDMAQGLLSDAYSRLANGTADIDDAEAIESAISYAPADVEGISYNLDPKITQECLNNEYAYLCGEDVQMIRNFFLYSVEVCEDTAACDNYITLKRPAHIETTYCGTYNEEYGIYIAKGSCKNKEAVRGISGELSYKCNGHETEFQETEYKACCGHVICEGHHYCPGHSINYTTGEIKFEYTTTFVDNIFDILRGKTFSRFGWTTKAIREDTLAKQLMPDFMQKSEDVSSWDIDKSGSSGGDENYRLYSGWTEEVISVVEGMIKQDWYKEYRLSCSLFDGSECSESEREDICYNLNIKYSDLDDARRSVLDAAFDAVGNVPTCYKGKAKSPVFEENDFGKLIAYDGSVIEDSFWEELTEEIIEEHDGEYWKEIVDPDSGVVYSNFGIGKEYFADYIQWVSSGERSKILENPASIQLKKLNENTVRPGDYIAYMNANGDIINTAVFLGYNTKTSIKMIGMGLHWAGIVDEALSEFVGFNEGWYVVSDF